jgi:hypothetical protein
MYKDYFLKDEVKAGFVWTEDMANFLKKYESNRDKYPTSGQIPHLRILLPGIRRFLK